MRYRETVDERLKKMAMREIGLAIKKYEFLFPINYTKSARSGGISLVFLCKSDRTTTGTFFKKMPKDIIPEHRILWRNVQKVIKKNRICTFPNIDKSM
ncbi:MAG: hypothetical protein ACD_81C00190G0017 [uncultured bacterium]|uniref:Uncharacterized protein n=1 Tax=Candidatus Wolfebacteria bacterium GW2011_GWC2_39_22 TaxID=1619013 RepID=A0A0G0N8X2_9BACT|nr:MAG: hypothetical protein ACD_81C00190G0017 [uncultured bacterium]KKR12589.1 MAG: hypothetical protein UT41_C0001G0133 [Candidatus Wolfebacteria bacterium GW2011_GWC2_39_22]HBI25790.1 hypothetical protein [Candidatus Wolfebacteria bacterium]